MNFLGIFNIDVMKFLPAEIRNEGKSLMKVKNSSEMMKNMNIFYQNPFGLN